MKARMTLILGACFFFGLNSASASSADHLNALRVQLLKEAPSKTEITLHLTPILWEVASLFASPKIHLEYRNPEFANVYSTVFHEGTLALLQEINPTCSRETLEGLFERETRDRGAKMESMILTVSTAHLAKFATDDCTAKKAVDLARIVNPSLASRLESNLAIGPAECSVPQSSATTRECNVSSLVEVLTSPGSRLIANFEGEKK